MGILFLVIVLVVNCLIYAACMAVGSRIAGGGGSFLHLFFIALIAATINLVPIPLVSWLVSIIVMLLLLNRWIGVDAFPEGVFIVVVAGGLSFLVRVFVLSAIANAFGAV